MSKTRRTFSKEFKSRVVLDALKEKDTIEELANKYSLLPSQISLWKADAIQNISAVFSVAKPSVKKDDFPTEKLFAEIGQLKMENDFLKKSFVRLFKGPGKDDRL